jgi:hypothetical protein
LPRTTIQDRLGACIESRLRVRRCRRISQGKGVNRMLFPVGKAWSESGAERAMRPNDSPLSIKQDRSNVI